MFYTKKKIGEFKFIKTVLRVWSVISCTRYYFMAQHSIKKKEKRKFNPKIYVYILCIYVQIFVKRMNYNKKLYIKQTPKQH